MLSYKKRSRRIHKKNRSKKVISRKKQAFSRKKQALSRKKHKNIQKIKYLSGSGVHKYKSIKNQGCGVLDFNTCVTGYSSVKGSGTNSLLKGSGTLLKGSGTLLRNCKYNFKNQICESVQKA